MKARFFFLIISFLSINLFAQVQNEDEIKRVVFSFGGEISRSIISDSTDALGDKIHAFNMGLLAGIEFRLLDHWSIGTGLRNRIFFGEPNLKATKVYGLVKYSDEEYAYDGFYTGVMYSHSIIQNSKRSESLAFEVFFGKNFEPKKFIPIYVEFAGEFSSIDELDRTIQPDSRSFLNLTIRAGFKF